MEVIQTLVLGAIVFYASSNLGREVAEYLNKIKEEDNND